MAELAPILSTLTDGILLLALNRPAQRNAMNREMCLQLTESISVATTDANVRVIVLQGSNGCFMAGNDLTDFTPVPNELLAMRLFRATAKCFKPIVAAVEGVAIGGGATILMHCDFVFAGASTRFSTPFVKLGVCAEGASSLVLPQIAGYKQAAEILLLGEPFSAQTAFAAGLITAVVDDGMAVEKSMETAKRLATMSPQVIQANKRLLKQQQLPRILETIDQEEREFLRLLAEEPAQKAIASFLAPRKT